MSYNKQYNTRHSTGRYNTPGQFVSAGEVQAGGGAGLGGGFPGAPQPQRKQPPPPAQPPPPPPPLSMHHAQGGGLASDDVDMKPAVEAAAAAGAGGDAPPRPHWMKSRLAGVKKLSNKEKRRRQNETLRRLLTPKNALMVLNEMLPHEQVANQFRVEPAPAPPHAPFAKPAQPAFCADLTIKGNSYKGYGENKLTARNVAAEQAFRDLVIEKMNKALGVDSGNGAGGEEEALPMIQLASFALHKLFSEWEYEGHKVPQLRPAPSESGSEAGTAAAAAAGVTARPPAPKKKELPGNAASMHPCMLLTYMRPALEYRELAVAGDRPQNMLFTLGVDVDGATYIGKASNKKEARKQAARAACSALWGVRFVDNPVDNVPQPPPPASA